MCLEEILVWAHQTTSQNDSWTTALERQPGVNDSERQHGQRERQLNDSRGVGERQLNDSLRTTAERERQLNDSRGVGERQLNEGTPGGVVT